MSAPGAEELVGLTPEQLIELMVAQEDRVPRALIDECARRGDAMADALSRLTDDPAFWLDDVSEGQWWLRLHAVMILGLIPSERAGRLLERLMRRMVAAGDDDLQDWIAGCWPALFANKPQTVIDAIRGLTADRGVDWYMHTGAAEVVVANAQRAGDEALERALDWLGGIAQDEGEDWDFRLQVGNMLLDFPRPRHRALLEGLAARQSWPNLGFSAKDVREAFAAARDQPDWERFADPWQFYSTEQIEKRQRRWAEEAEDDRRKAARLEMPETYVKEIPKVGRNDPCPCGSGKKYKHCHLEADEAQRRK